MTAGNNVIKITGANSMQIETILSNYIEWKEKNEYFYK